MSRSTARATAARRIYSLILFAALALLAAAGTGHAQQSPQQKIDEVLAAPPPEVPAELLPAEPVSEAARRERLADRIEAIFGTSPLGSPGAQTTPAKQPQPTAPATAPAPRWVVLETVTVPADRPETVDSKTVLEAGTIYRLEARGTFSAWGGEPVGIDALYCDRAGRCEPPQAWNQLRVDGRGLNEFRAERGAPLLGYNPEHVYAAELEGAGAPLRLHLWDAVENASSGDNSGAIEVTLYGRMQPPAAAAAPALAPAPGLAGGAASPWVLLETVSVPADRAEAVRSRLRLEAGTTYRLEVRGTFSAWGGEPVGIDALYCDRAGRCPSPELWQQLRVDGRGLNEIRESRGEPALSYDSGHVYRVEVDGTGAPLALHIWDAVENASAGDNSGALEVAIFGPSSAAVAAPASPGGAPAASQPATVAPAPATQPGSDWVLLETITLPGDQAKKFTSKTVLVAGRDYRLVARGSFSAWGGDPVGIDAVYCDRAGRCAPPEPWQQLRVDDRGFNEIRKSRGEPVLPYNPEHVYAVELEGKAAPLELHLWDAIEAGSAGGNTGAIEVAIYGPAGAPAPGGDVSAAPSGGGYLGCYRDQGDPQGTGGRDLSGAAFNHDAMTVELCRATCQGDGFAFAGVQYGRWCFCGNSYGASGPADNCDRPCSGDSGEICGGSWANSVYGVGTGAGPGDGLGPERNNRAVSVGKQLTFYPSPSAASCRADCAARADCAGYTWVRPGGYQPGEPSVCYLMSEIEKLVEHTCCVTATRQGAGQ